MKYSMNTGLEDVGGNGQIPVRGLEGRCPIQLSYRRNPAETSFRLGWAQVPVAAFFLVCGARFYFEGWTAVVLVTPAGWRL